MKPLAKFKLGISEHKQAELNKLTREVTGAGYVVAEQKTVLVSLTAKLTEFEGYLSNAEKRKETTLSNLDLLNVVLAQTKALKKHSATVVVNTNAANNSAKDAVLRVSNLIKDLIFVSEYINNLRQVISRKKAFMPLISDDLIKVMTNAGANANIAVAATLTALQSCYAANSSCKESLDILMLESVQCDKIVHYLEGKDVGGVTIADVDLLRAQLSAAVSAVGVALTNVSLQATAQGVAIVELKTCQNALETTEKQILALKAKSADLAAKLAEKPAELEAAEHKLLKKEAALRDAQDNLGQASDAEKEAAEIAVENATEQQQGAEVALTALSWALTDLQAEQGQLAQVKADTQKTIKTNNLALVNSYKSEAAESEKLIAAYASLEAAKQNLDAAFSALDAGLKYIEKSASGQRKTSLDYMLNHAYAEAVEKYKAELKATHRVKKEVDEARAKLLTVTNKLNSLNAGLEAATAAALAA